jgi:hypothetical protein
VLIRICLKQYEKLHFEDSSLKTLYAGSSKTFVIAGLALVGIAGSLSAQDPATNQTFEQVVSGMPVIRWYDFRAGGNSSNLDALAQNFNPYGIAGTTPTHQEWERYQGFNSDNFRFNPDGLYLTATLPWWGGMWEGGIASGQIWTKEGFKPGVTGYNTYAIMVRMKIPRITGEWAQSWLYSRDWWGDDGSEIDNPEFMNSEWQNQYNWTGYDHGNAYSIFFDARGNPWTWTPGTDFSSDYHDFELVWTPDATYKYVDGQLILAQQFWWTASSPAQLGTGLAVGSWEIPGLIPQNWGDFPASLAVQYIGMWAK